MDEIENKKSSKEFKENSKDFKDLKPLLDESNFTPEQKAKAELKRKQKADKAAVKNLAKEMKKGSGRFLFFFLVFLFFFFLISDLIL